MNIRPKKALGQNFLRDEKVLEKIISAANLKPDDFIIEIGPGEGALTEKLAKRAGKVLAIEIDADLVKLLRNKFSNKKSVEIVEGDILKIDLRQLISNFQFFPQQRDPAKAVAISNKIPSSESQVPSHSYKVVANLPYYITSPIIRLFLESKFPPKEMVLMVQKEVAERIVAKPGKMSILAVSVQYYAHPELLFHVSKDSFQPIPEVDSAVIHITYNMKQGTRKKDEAKNFFRVVRAGFSAKRKMLVNNLTNGFYLDKKEVEEKLKKVPLNGTARAQELSMEDWKKLTLLFSE